MVTSWFSVVVDCRDPAGPADFWCRALGYRVVSSDDDEVDIAPDEGRFPGLVFLRVDDAKTVKNRLHLDLNPDDQAAEVARLIALGATRVDVGQRPDASWTVLADPEGNEFCVLTPQEGW
jgi:Glyoxalase-like domain